MPLNKLKELNKSEGIKNAFNVTGYIEEIQKMGFKKFWKANNKVIYLIAMLIVGAILVQMFRTSHIITLIKTQESWAKAYFFISTFLYTGIAIFILNFTLTISLKQDYNTDAFMRAKMSKMKGIDWKTAEAPFQKKKK